MAAHPEAQIIFGAVIDEHMADTMRVTVIATGFGDDTVEISTQAAPALTARSPISNRPKFTAPASPPEYEVHEKFNQEAFARWQAFTQAGSEGPAAEEAPLTERTLEVPTFFRRRARRQR
jgi:cell division protein FtsZ